MNIIEFHYVGGLIWMIFLSLTLVVNIILIVRVAIFYSQQKQVNKNYLDLIRQIGGFALAFGAFSTLVAFFQAFRDLSAMAEMIPIQHIYGGLQVALITVLYGFGIFLFTLVALMGLNFLKKE
jgi:hypothetical protein